MLRRRVTLLAVTLVFALTLSILHVDGAALARCEEGANTCDLSVRPYPALSDALLGLSYVQVLGGAPVYASPSDPANGIGPVNWLGSGFVWTSITSPNPILDHGAKFYPKASGGYIPAQDVLVFQPSAFHGVAFTLPPDHPFAWVEQNIHSSPAPGAPAAASAPAYNRYDFVYLLDQQNANGLTWYRVGDNAWIDQTELGIVKPSPRPDSVGPNDQWIEVNLSEQTLAAYQGDQLVYSTLVSSGLPQWGTDPGLFRIYVKFRDAPMSGDQGKPGSYSLDDVAWTMYFNGDMALHSAYWHDLFGAPHSHGCVNLAPIDAEWLFNWTTPVAGSGNRTDASDQNPGTWVWVHN